MPIFEFLVTIYFSDEDETHFVVAETKEVARDRLVNVLNIFSGDVESVSAGVEVQSIPEDCKLFGSSGIYF